jgi:hypothetical protein
MNSMNIRITAPEQLQIVSEFAETMQMPLTKAVVLAVMLAKKYQNIELENRALRQALASTQSTNEGFYAFVSSEMGKK